MEKEERRNELVMFFTFLGVVILFILLSLIDVYKIRYKFNDTSYYASLSYFNVIFKGDIKLVIGSEENSFLLQNVGIDVIGILFFILFISGVIIYLVNEIITLTINKKIVLLNVVSSILLFLSLILFVIEPYTYSSLHHLNDLYNGFSFKEVNIESVCFSFLLIFIFIALNFALKDIKRNEKEVFNVKDLTEMGMMVALSLILDKIKIGIGATGGSINLSMLPLLIYSYRHGFIKGLVASSVVFGLLSNLIDGYGFNTYPFDYFIAFFGYSLPGLFKILFNKLCKDNEYLSMLYTFISSCILAFIIRMIGSSLSSIINYGYSLKDSLIYNCLYVGPSTLISLIAAILLIKPLSIINKKFSND